MKKTISKGALSSYFHLLIFISSKYYLIAMKISKTCSCKNAAAWKWEYSFINDFKKCELQQCGTSFILISWQIPRQIDRPMPALYTINQHTF